MDAETKNTLTNQNSLEKWLSLHHTPGIGNATFHTLLETFGTVDAIFNASHKQLSALAIKSAFKTDVFDALSKQSKPDISADL